MSEFTKWYWSRHLRELQKLTEANAELSGACVHSSD